MFNDEAGKLAKAIEYKRDCDKRGYGYEYGDCHAIYMKYKNEILTEAQEKNIIMKLYKLRDLIISARLTNLSKVDFAEMLDSVDGRLGYIEKYHLNLNKRTYKELNKIFKELK